MGQPADGAIVFKLGCLQQRYELLPENAASAEIGDALQRVRSASLASSVAASSQVVAASSQVVSSRDARCGPLAAWDACSMKLLAVPLLCARHSGEGCASEVRHVPAVRQRSDMSPLRRPGAAASRQELQLLSGRAFGMLNRILGCNV